MKYINTVEELKKYVGKIVLFYYTDTHKKDGTIRCAWAKKITKIKGPLRLERRYSRTPIDGVFVYGTNTILFKSEYKNTCPILTSTMEKYSNAQEFARELDVYESIIYRMLVKREEAIKKGLIKYEFSI